MNAKLLGQIYEACPIAESQGGRPEYPEEDIADALPAGELPPGVQEGSLLGMIELLLKHPARVDQLARDEVRQAEVLPRFLAIVLASFSVFALALVLLLEHADRAALPELLREHWSGGFGPAFSLWAAYTLGMVAASGICLPSFYFFGLLVGVRISVLQVTGHIMKGKASTAVMLLGVLPIYVAVVLGMVVFAAPVADLELVLTLGLALPFLAGLWGVHAIYRGFLAMADTLPPSRRYRRTCFLRRLTVAWAACYSIVMPVMIYTLWNFFVTRLAE
jgi:hypothetical protein